MDEVAPHLLALLVALKHRHFLGSVKLDEVMGGKATNAYKDSRIRAAVYADIYSQIKREFGLYDDKGRMRFCSLS